VTADQNLLPKRFKIIELWEVLLHRGKCGKGEGIKRLHLRRPKGKRGRAGRFHSIYGEGFFRETRNESCKGGRREMANTSAYSKVVKKNRENQ